MASHQPAKEPGDRLRLIAVTSVAALAVVLPLAAATAGPHDHDSAHRGNAGHSASQGVPDGGSGDSAPAGSTGSAGAADGD
ncbi:hypothetical protein [Actinacidiphila bryophytorum]|uniref:Uncharacterized protein n=1 Tax=Actinacidiphila bryophytorum TaxID=1436133 RepID=A0A9W4H4L6_9ACTN|nr:hypothetical protein [Actinacidiphila bryophytorum]MBM9437199.1 hypothetical protein [Actinacidiphila bryophytorum]MBN6543255.1 hypothetical protein [Actinacidiphila bryophytorum]CAG7651026.1 conserved exported hypothetical protein [Actinacidiphila bryophytorum]